MRAVRQQPEKVLKERVLTWLRFKGFLAWHIPNHGMMRSGHYCVVDKFFVAGIPDLEVMLRGGVTVRIELKSKVGVVSDAQKAVMGRLNALGHPSFVARTLEEVEAFFKAGGYI